MRRLEMSNKTTAQSNSFRELKLWTIVLKTESRAATPKYTSRKIHYLYLMMPPIQLIFPILKSNTDHSITDLPHRSVNRSITGSLLATWYIIHFRQMGDLNVSSIEPIEKSRESVVKGVDDSSVDYGLRKVENLKTRFLLSHLPINRISYG